MASGKSVSNQQGPSRLRVSGSKLLIPALTFSLLIASLSISYVPNARALTIDGTVTDIEWNYWFEDHNCVRYGSYSENFSITAYWYADSANLYIAVNTTDRTIGNTPSNWDEISILIDAPPLQNGTIGNEDINFHVETRPNTPYAYNPFCETGVNGGWSGPEPMPPGASFIAGQTGIYRSYELCVPVSLLNLTSGDIVRVGFTVHDRPSYANHASLHHPHILVWTDPTNWEPTPPLPIPEVPLGTMLLLATSFTTYFMLKRFRTD